MEGWGLRVLRVVYLPPERKLSAFAEQPQKTPYVIRLCNSPKLPMWFAKSLHCSTKFTCHSSKCGLNFSDIGLSTVFNECYRRV